MSQLFLLSPDDPAFPPDPELTYTNVAIALSFILVDGPSPFARPSNKQSSSPLHWA